MLTKRQTKTAVVTFLIAVGSGHLMQYGVAGATKISTPAPRPALQEPIYEIETSNILSGALFAPQAIAPSIDPILPKTPGNAALPSRPLESLAVPTDTAVAPLGDDQMNINGFGISCDPQLAMTAQRGAMVKLSLVTGCKPETRVDISHSGISFTEETDAAGQLTLDIPALSSPAQFTIQVEGEDALATSVDLPDITDHDRVALQWSGANGLSIQALEFGAEPGTKGHVSADDPHSPLRGMLAHGGFLTRLGKNDSEDAGRVEIYSFPSGTTRRDGVVRLHVEAQVTPLTCGQTIEAHALQTRPSGSLRRIDLSVAVPGCDAVGNTLVLKNVLQDLKIAQN